MRCSKAASVSFVSLVLVTLAALAYAGAPAARVVTLAPSLAEIAAEVLGPGELGRIVGVTDYTDFPKELRDRPSVGSFARPNREKLLSLKPDLVLATRDGTSQSAVDSIRESHVPVVIVAGDSLDDVTRSFGIVGDALGRGEQGRAAQVRFQKSLDSIRDGSRKCKRPRVLFQFEAGPRDPIIAVGARNFVNDAVAIAGAENIYGAAGGERYPHPSVEDVIRRNPDLIVVFASQPNGGKAAADKARAFWGRYGGLKAAKAPDGIRALESDELQRPGPRLIEGLRKLKKLLHGDSC